jgi:hypothetical protein
VYAVGSSILHYDGARWRPTPLPSQTRLRAVWTTGHDVFAVGDSGVAYRGDGNQWTITATGTTESLNAVWGSSATDVYALSHYAVHHFDGVAWSALYKTKSYTAMLIDVGGSGPADVYVVGTKGTYPLVLHFDGSAWTENLSTEVVAPAAVWAASKNDVFVAGQKGTIIHFDGSKWTLQHSTTDNDLRFVDLHGSGPNDVYAVGEFGDLWHYDGSTWTAKISRFNGAHSIWSDGAGHLFAGGGDGPLMLEGNEWRPLTTSKRLHGVWGYGAGELVAVGEAGTIVQFDGARWRVVTAGQQDLIAVWGPTADTLIAVGRKGTILHHSGAGWSASPAPTDADLRGVWGASPTNVVAVGERGTVLHYDGVKWSVAPPVTTEWLADVWGSGADSIFAVGWNG